MHHNYGSEQILTIMKIAIMQPYIFPYIGYFQLIQAVDLFVLYDDVQYIKKGWINRNRILLNGKEHTFTIPCLGASQNKLIKDVCVAWSGKELKKLSATVEAAYHKAPHFKEVNILVQEVLHDSKQETIADLASESIRRVCAYLGVSTTLTRSSQADYANTDLRKGDRMADIVLKENGTDCINAIGGKALYTKEFFDRYGVKLHFLQSEPICYPQSAPGFVPWLSIIDVLMYNDKNKIATFLQSYHLL